MRFLDRTSVIVAGWTAAAILAVLVGVVGIGLVGSGLTSERAATVLPEDEVERALGSAPTTNPTNPKSAPASNAAKGQTFNTIGGTVVAACDRIISMAPAQGWAVHDQDQREGEFRNGRDRVEVELSCVNGAPRLEVSND
ncbi:hypothetical protein [Paractinoplanes atraurantiacus]|uniref:Uncharacterized protein n=1 Tax=Paractinoplanes atraurantiacus TaxID=1036182 RepID=A0A285KMQ3_9ACTN|nr:hypothetical protein [Actinoplanes atraurantiacus]SNY73919.1 hypothetical protein SAMN05421748_14930 [Actinoplanes atraurantiacus]